MDQLRPYEWVGHGGPLLGEQTFVLLEMGQGRG